MGDGESTGGAPRPDGPDERAPARRRRRVSRAARPEPGPRPVDEGAAGAELPVPRGSVRRPATLDTPTGRAQEAPAAGHAPSAPGGRSPVPGPRPAEPVVPAQRTRR